MAEMQHKVTITGAGFGIGLAHIRESIPYARMLNRKTP